ncbi:SDR family oxidoreductase [Streptomyces naganishii]|uniref:NmrA family transcriptional regulator n=1 Tax=Streptomyces naganishii JCM 4654 TaxID=1306179 RepID=A0A918Y9S6_9ACTN|nr:NAD(P)H-binding protein [Streptomyces naganishii]GHD96065.1 NmrA family transcriptional regulator [Streptomyces naganishii JCM 4654]
MITVTGATGNVGRELVRILAEGGEAVTAVSRGEARDLPVGVPHVRADLADPGSLRPALDGADALFLLVAGDDPQGVVDAARAAGVRRVVLVSSLGVATRPDAYRHPAAFETALRGSGLDWTVLRCGGLNSNAFAWAGAIRADRVAAAPFGDVGLPMVDPADVAEVAAAALLQPGHAGAVYELTGPAPTTPRERAAAIGAALGEPVRFVEQTREEAREQMLAFMPEPVVEGTLAILGEPLRAERRVSPDVERVLGRAPRPFAEWASRSTAAFR